MLAPLGASSSPATEGGAKSTRHHINRNYYRHSYHRRGIK